MLLERSGGRYRFVKNPGKERRELAWRHTRHRVSCAAQSKEILPLRKDPVCVAALLEPVPTHLQAPESVTRARRGSPPRLPGVIRRSSGDQNAER